MSHAVTPIRPRLARYGDTHAVNDVHALLTAPSGQPLAILERKGAPS